VCGIQIPSEILTDLPKLCKIKILKVKTKDIASQVNDTGRVKIVIKEEINE
jgi:hypothetical protein